MIIAFGIVGAIMVGVFAVLNHPKFGKLPTGERLARLEKSPNYKNGAFKNLNFTPQMTGEGGFLKIMKDFRDAKNRKPVDQIPLIKTDLLNLERDKDVLVWFGHSSYFM